MARKKVKGIAESGLRIAEVAGKTPAGTPAPLDRPGPWRRLRLEFLEKVDRMLLLYLLRTGTLDVELSRWQRLGEQAYRLALKAEQTAEEARETAREVLQPSEEGVKLPASQEPELQRLLKAWKAAA